MTLSERALSTLWFPCSQMKDYEQFPPIPVKGASGSYLHLEDGRHLIDAISSWWCKSLGHGHPALKAALYAQANRFEHIILANTCNETIVKLSEKLARLCAPLNKVMYASDGSCAVEMALKMSLHAQYLKGQTKRKRFAALANGYHGETMLTLAVSDLGLYKAPYAALCPEVTFLQNIPYVNGESDPLWQDCTSHWDTIKTQLDEQADTLAAVIVEPIVQGACGMKIYSPDLLRKLRSWCDDHDVYLIADEILTGIGRTGKALACEHAGITPDFCTVSKGLTSGWLPLSAMITSDDIYDLFYDDYETGKAFMHSHTHSGNPLAAAVAIACLDTMEKENIYETVSKNSAYCHQQFQHVAEVSGRLENIRCCGYVMSADLITIKPRAGYAVYQEAVKLGALLRPLGNTLYWLPPLNTERDTIDALRDITLQAIQNTPLDTTRS